MRPGTPGFIGTRLKEAHEARSLTAIALAELLGVTRQSISQYETGLRSPSPEVMHKIATTLNLPEHFFLRPTKPLDNAPVFYRSLSAVTKGARARAEHRYSWLREIVAYLRESVQFPEVHFPSFDLPEDPNRLSSELIEEIAGKTRRFWSLGNGPISNIVWLLENNGAVVARDELGADTLDAFSQWFGPEDTPYIVLGSDKRSAARSRFDAAHEVGHMVLHRTIMKVRLFRSSEFKLIEGQAHRFAAAFLLPAQSFVEDLYAPSVDAMRALKPKWKVSIGMMIKRAEHLELISEDKARRLWASYARRGWKTFEPLDDTFPPEEPRLLRRAFDLILRENPQGRGALLSQLPFAIDDIEGLAGLPKGFLSEMPPEVRFLDEARADRIQREEGSSDQPGQIVQFPTRRSRP